uniref:Uncharacterized protein n=1 Tax=Gossypium raimondii TaxID=29730 RepID=A0A0D2QXR9_GOSRA|nr:hypothetical protein B456_002G075500 [Gossypium raimondii]
MIHQCLSLLRRVNIMNLEIVAVEGLINPAYLELLLWPHPVPFINAVAAARSCQLNLECNGAIGSIGEIVMRINKIQIMKLHYLPMICVFFKTIM